MQYSLKRFPDHPHRKNRRWGCEILETRHLLAGGVNHPPTLNSVTALSGAQEDKPFYLSYTTLLNAADEADSDGDPISFRITHVSAGKLTLNGAPVVPGTSLLAANQWLSWTPPSNLFGEIIPFSLAAWDGLAASATVPVRVNAASVNDPPTITTLSTFSGGLEDTPYAIAYDQLRAAANEADVDGDPVQFLIHSVASGTTLLKNGAPIIPGSTLIGSGDQLSWIPPVNKTGLQYAFNVKAWDGNTASYTGLPVYVNLQAVNDPPQLTSITTFNNIPPQAPFTISYSTLLAAADEFDAEFARLSFRVMSVHAGALTRNGVPVVPGETLFSVGQSFTWLPPTNAMGNVAAFALAAWDGVSHSMTPVMVRFQMLNSNHEPTLSNIQSIPGEPEDTTTTLNFNSLLNASNAADADGDTLAFRVETLLAGTLTKNGTAVVPGQTLFAAGEQLAWLPPANRNGTIAAFSVRAWDGSVASAEAIPVVMNIAAVNDAPTFTQIVALPPAMATGQWFVAPNGKPQGDGSAANPWDLSTALGDNAQPGSVNKKIVPGDTVWLLPGTYSGSFTSRLQGTAEKPIIVRNFNHQRATIDHAAGEGISVVAGGYVWFWGLEFAASNSARYSKDTSSFPMDISTGVHLSFNNSRGMKVINSIFHDGSGAVGASSTSQDIEFTGNLMYYAGWKAPDRTHGHGAYAQNKDGYKKFVDNIIFNNASHGMHAYGSSAAFISGFQMEGNVLFNNGELFDDTLRGRNFLLGGGATTRDSSLVGNMIYRHDPTVHHSSSDLMLGFGTGMTNSTIRDNYVVGETRLSGAFNNVEIKTNTFVGGMWSDPARDVKALYPNNQYVTTRPAEAKVFVRANPYEAGRGNVTIYNWPLANNINIDPAPLGLKSGDAYELHNALDFYGDVIRGTYQGGMISVPMTGHTVSAPVGIPAPATTFPEFGSFILIKPGAVTNPGGTTSGGVYALPFEALATAANESDVDHASLSFRIVGAGAGSLTLNNTTVVPNTIFTAGQTLNWTPPTNATGNVIVCYVVAWDGSLASSTPIPVIVPFTSAASVSAVDQIFSNWR